MIEAVAESCEALDDYYEPVLKEKVHSVVKNSKVADQLFQKLVEIGLYDFEKALGSGASGTVYQVNAVALKVLRFSELNKISSDGHQGEFLALDLPDHRHLCKTYGILTYDGGRVHYVEKFDAKVHSGQIILGTVSEAIEGNTLYERMKKGAMTAQEVKGYGKHMAEAIEAIHRAGYAHKDIHPENVLIENPGPGRLPYSIKVIDFNGGNDATADRVRKDWRNLAFLLAEMAEEELLFDPHFYDLIYSEKHGLLNGHQPYSDVQVINHPFFR